MSAVTATSEHSATPGRQLSHGAPLRSSGAVRGLIALGDQGLVSFTNFATAVLIGRVCGKTELGIYMLAWSLLTIATGVFTTLIAAPYTVFSPQMGPSRRRLYLGSILVHHLSLSVLSGLLMAAGAFAGSWQGWLPNATADVFITVAAATVSFGLREFIRSVGFAELRMGWALWVDLTACLAQAGALLLLLQFGGLTAFRAFAVLGISSAVAAGSWFVFHRGEFRFDRRLFAPDFNRNWKFAKWVLGSGVLWHCAGYLFPWVLAAFHGASITGIWAACSGIVALGNPALLGAGNYVLPKISSAYAAEGPLSMQRYVQRYSLLFIALFLPVVLVSAVSGERILTGVYGSAYGGAGGILTLLAANMLIINLARPYAQGLFSLECARADTYVNAVWVGLLFAVGIPAAKSYAAIGAAAATLSCSAVAVVIKIIVFTREVRNRSGIVPAHGCPACASLSAD